MKKYKLIAFFTLCLFLQSCYTDIDLEHLRPAPKLVLNCIVSPDSCIVAAVSRTWFLTENNPDVTINTAKVELYMNGTYQEDMEWIPVEDSEETGRRGGHYSSNVWPKPGDHVKVTVSAEGYNPVEAETTVPQKVPIEKVEVTLSTEKSDWAMISVDGEGNYVTTWDRDVLTYRITFHDPADQTNYYLVRITPNSYLDFSVDPIFKDHVTFLDDMFSSTMLEGVSGFVFSDERINGETYTLKIKDELYGKYYPQEEEIREVQLYSISYSYYHYYLSLAQAAEDGSFLESLAGVGMAEPLKIYSNVEGGTGIMIGSQRFSETIDITYLFEE